MSRQLVFLCALSALFLYDLSFALAISGPPLGQPCWRTQRRVYPIRSLYSIPSVSYGISLIPTIYLTISLYQPYPVVVPHDLPWYHSDVPILSGFLQHFLGESSPSLRPLCSSRTRRCRSPICSERSWTKSGGAPAASAESGSCPCLRQGKMWWKGAVPGGHS